METYEIFSVYAPFDIKETGESGGAPPVVTFNIELEDGSGFIELEDGSGVILLEDSP